MAKPHFSVEPYFTAGGGSGASAYEVAVENGFVGDETAWLASLKGVKGDTGDAFTYADFAPGELAALKGPKGDPGTDGNDGFGTQAQYNALVTSIGELTARLDALGPPE